MGYSKSISTLRLMEPALSLIAQGQPCEWQRLSEDADVWAYKIREALFIARTESLRRPGDEALLALSNASKMFTIQVVSPTLVRAVYANQTEVTAEPRPSAQALTPGPTHRLSQLRTAEDLQTAWQVAQPSNDKLHFPDAQLSDTELFLAAAWAASLTPPWMILRPKGTNALTLAPDDPRVPDAAKLRAPKRAVSADDPPAQMSDKSLTGRTFGALPKSAPAPTPEPPDEDGHGDEAQS